MSNVVASELTIKMAVDYATMKADMDKVASTVGATGESISKAMSLAKTAIIGMLGVASVNGFKDMILGAIESVGKLNDLAASAGVSAGALGALSKVASFSGVSAETMAGAMNKLNLQLVKQGEDGKGAAAALKAIGIDYTAFVALNPDQRIQAVATAMAGYKDGTEKSAVAMLLFGKSGAALVPVLKDLAAAGELNAKWTDEQIAAADDFSDDLVRLKVSGEAWKKELAMGMLPALGDLAKVMLAVTNESGGLRDELKKLSEDGSIDEWTRDAITGLTYLADAGSFVIKSMKSIGLSIGAVAALAVTLFGGLGKAIGEFLDGEFSKSIDTMSSAITGTVEINRQANEDLEALWSKPTIGSKIRERMAQTAALRQEQKDWGDDTEASKPKIDTSGLNEANAEAIKKEKDELEKLRKAAGDYLITAASKIASMQAESSLQRPLTDGEKLMAKAVEETTLKKVLFTEAQWAELKAKAKQMDALQAEKTAQKELADAEEEAYKARVKSGEAALKEAADIAVKVVKQLEENEAVGKTKEQLELLSVGRLKDEARVMAQVVAEDELLQKCTAETEAHKLTLASLNDLIAAKQRNITLETIQKLTDETKKQLEQNEAFGKTGDELAKLEIVRLKDQAAMLAQKVAQEDLIGLCNEETIAHADTLAALNKLIDAKEKGVHLQAAKEALEAWQNTAKAIGDDLTDALMRGFESGKSFMEEFKKLLVDSFSKLVLRPIIQAVMAPVSGAMASMFSGGAQAAGAGGGGNSMLSALAAKYGLGSAGGLGSIFSGGASLAMNGGSMMGLEGAGSMMANGSMLQGAAQGAGVIAGWAGPIAIGQMAGRAISGGYSAMGGQSGSTAVNAGTIIGAIVGGPIGAGIGAAIGGLVNRAFGMAAKENQAGGIQGSITGGSTTGQSYQDWTQKGGWFRSDKAGTNYSALNDNVAAALDMGAASVLEQTKAWAEALKLPANALATVTTDFKVALTSDQAANTAALSLLFTQYQAALTEQFTAVIEPFKQAGESIAETMQRLVVLSTFSDAFNELGGIFSKVADSSIAARENIIALAGGIDQLMAKAGQFVKDYYTQGEQAGMQAKATVGMFRELGIDGGAIASRDDFRKLVESIDVGSEAGQKQLVALLEIAPTFAALADYIKENKTTLEAVAAQAPTVAVLDQMLPEQQATSEAVTDVATRIKEGNATLTAIETAIKAGNVSIATGLAAMASAQSAVAAAQAEASRIAAKTNSAINNLAGNQSLADSAPGYTYDIGAAQEIGGL